MLQNLRTSIVNGVKVIIVTRPSEDSKKKNNSAWRVAVEMIREAGANVVFKSNIHQKFAVVDQKVVWYGGINLLSFGNAEESIMRLESVNIANELIKELRETHLHCASVK
jgi:phosphatidylserine/phosphatidylglycerophosphate/cardiolipin synthase-like enzyme